MKASFSFKNTLIFNFILVALLPLILIGFITLTIFTGYLEKEIARKDFLLAKSVGGEIGAFIDQPEDMLRQIAAMIEGGAMSNEDLFRASLESIISNYPVFEMIEVIDEAGRITEAVPFRKNYIGLNVSGKPFFKEIKHVRDLHWSSTYISPYTGEPTLTVALPLRNGVLAGILNLGILSDFIDRLEKGPMKIGVMDRNGTFIAHSVRSNVYQRVNVRTLEGVGQALSGIEGNYRVRERGKEVFLSVALVPQTGWPVVVIQTVDQAFAPVYKVRNYFWIGIGLALFLALIMALLRVKRIIKPLSRLISDAKKIEKGDYHFPPQPKSYPEIDELSKDLRMMANAVAGREETLQKLQEQMLHAKKMEAIGTLAGGIAHDFNNLLMGIQGNISLMLMDKEPGSLHYDRLRSMEQQVHRGAELTRQLLGFARGGKYQVQPTDLNELIRNQCVMFGRTRKEIAIHETLHKDLWVVAVDRGQIEQVLLNLFVNAWQAMPGGGNLFVGTENVTLGTDHAKLFQLTPGQYVHISVTDTGVGIDEDILGRIFDPFFTTKAIGKGTGLGLASAYGIIKNHDGIIDVHSEKGKGCTFDIYLPVTELKVEVQEPKIEKNLRTGDETILLVDDEDIIIDVGKTMLNRMGYNVLIAGNGEEAVEIIRKGLETSPPPDLTILDMIMPDMGGGETFDRLKEIAPDLKVLLSSGYNINGEAKEILARGCNGFIQKPFDIHALSLKIREVLDKRGY